MDKFEMKAMVDMMDTLNLVDVMYMLYIFDILYIMKMLDSAIYKMDRQHCMKHQHKHMMK